MLLIENAFDQKKTFVENGIVFKRYWPKIYWSNFLLFMRHNLELPILENVIVPKWYSSSYAIGLNWHNSKLTYSKMKLLKKSSKLLLKVVFWGKSECFHKAWTRILLNERKMKPCWEEIRLIQFNCTLTFDQCSLVSFFNKISLHDWPIFDQIFVWTMGFVVMLGKKAKCISLNIR